MEFHPTCRHPGSEARVQVANSLVCRQSHEVRPVMLLDEAMPVPLKRARRHTLVGSRGGAAARRSRRTADCYCTATHVRSG